MMAPTSGADMSQENSEDSANAAGGQSAAFATLAAASQAKADTFLDEQTRLARLQSQNLIDQNAFELSHLRWRRFNDQMKGALQIMLVLVGIAILFGIAAAFWRASQADGLVVDGFSAPPVLAQSGITSEVIAQDI